MHVSCKRKTRGWPTAKAETSRHTRKLNSMYSAKLVLVLSATSCVKINVTNIYEEHFYSLARRVSVSHTASATLCAKRCCFLCGTFRVQGPAR